MVKKFSTAQIITIGTVVPLVSFGIVFVLVYQNMQSMLEDERWVTHTHLVIEKIDGIQSNTFAVESGGRAYAATGNPTYIDQYGQSKQHILSDIKDVQSLTADNPTQQDNIKALMPIIQSKLDFNEKLISLRNNGSGNAAIALLNGGEGDRISDSISSKLGEMKNFESNLLTARMEASQASSTNTFDIIIFGGIAATAVTVLTKFFIDRKLVEKEKVEKENLDLHVESEKQKERENAKDELSAMISHELKTPLVTINGYAEMLKEDGILGTLNKDQFDAVESIHQHGIKLDRLIGDIMDVQKLDLQRMKFNMNRFSVDEFMNELSYNYAKIMKEKEIHFVNSTDEKITLTSDENRLTQVFSNLIKNSVDFVPEKTGDIEIKAQKKGDKVLFYVKDNGCGIPREKQANLFKKFYQIDTSLKRKHGGTGLGLVICKGIMDALGGEIWFESDVGKGTTFWVSLPIRDPADA